MATNATLHNPQASTLNIPTNTGQAQNASAGETLTCCGRTWKWIVDYIFDPIGKCFKAIFDLIAKIFCCCSSSPANATAANPAQPTTGADSVPANAPGTSSRPIAYLPPPAQISGPRDINDPIAWPADTVIPPALKQLLQFLTSSNECLAATPGQNSLLVTAPPESETPAAPPEAQGARTREALRLKMQQHLSAVVEKLRNPSPEAPLTKEHIEDLKRTIYPRLSLQATTATVYDLLFRLFEVLNCPEPLNAFIPAVSQLTQIVYPDSTLPKPDNMPAPCEIDASSIPSISGTIIEEAQKPLNDFLKLLASSPTADDLLSSQLIPVEPTHGSSDTPLQTQIKQKRADTTNFNTILLRNHLSGVIEKLRTQNPDDPLTPAHLQTLLQLIRSCGGNNRGDAFELMKFFCIKFNGDIPKFNQLYQDHFFASLPRLRLDPPIALAPAKQIEEVQTPFSTETATENVSLLEVSASVANEDDETIALNALTKTLRQLASKADWDARLDAEIPRRQIVRTEQDTDITYFGKNASAARQQIVSNALRQMLRRVVNEIRSTNDTSYHLNQEDVAAFLLLFRESGINCRSGQEMLESIARLLNVAPDARWDMLTPIIWEELRETQGTRSFDLPTVNNGLVSRPLPNLGSTCYLSSVLQMMAQLTCFDQMLTHQIAPADEKKEALQAHLRTIIGILRQHPSNEITVPVDASLLKVLFKLLQVNGWHHNVGEQNDPQELIAHLRGILQSDDLQVHVREVYTYTTSDGQNHSFINEASLAELALPLPINVTTRELLPGYETIDSLITHYSDEPETISGYRLPDNSLADLRKIHKIVEAPETLFIQLKRFGFGPSLTQPDNFETYRINGNAPFSDRITLKVYDPNNLDAPPAEHAYQLKIVVGHHGGSSANSGHYTAWALQTITQSGWPAPKDTWIYYDDSSRPRRYKCDPTPHDPQLQVAVREKGYYLAYVRVPEKVEHVEEEKVLTSPDGAVPPPSDQSTT